MEGPRTTEYSDAGVDYDALDAAKRLSIAKGLSTAARERGRGLRVGRG